MRTVSAASPDTALRAALALRDRPDEALPLVLDAWRHFRAQALGDLVRELAGAETMLRGPVPGHTRAERERRFHLIAQQGDVCDTQRLCDCLFTLRREQAEVLLAQLDDRLPDPVVADALVRGLVQMPPGFQSRAALGFWSNVLRIVERSGDARTLALLDRASTPFRESRAPSPAQLYLVRAIPDTQSVIRNRRVADDDPRIRMWLDDLRVTEIDRSLLDAVYEDPADLERRDVLADALMQAGDPRGTFIALQRSRKRDPKQQRAMQHLLEQHGRRWLGPLAPVLQRTGLQFRNGFPSEGRLESDARVNAWEGLREWRTFEALDATRWPEAVPLFRDQEWPVLHTLVGVPLSVLSNSGLTALERFTEGRRDAPPFQSLADARVRLAYLTLTGNTSNTRPLAIDWKLPALASLRELAIEGDRDRWLEAAPQIPGSHLLTIRADARDPWTYSFWPGRTHVEVHFGWTDEPTGWLREAPRIVDALQGRVVTVEVKLRDTTFRSADDIAELERVLRRLGPGVDAILPRRSR